MIPLVIALWENVNFAGRRRVLAEDEPSLVSEGFDNVVSSIGVHAGPDYGAWKAANGGQEPTVGIYKDLFYGGAQLQLKVGVYPDIKALYNFGDVASSIKFNPPSVAPHPFDSIPLIVHVYKDANFSGQQTQIVENVPNISNYLGGDWNDSITSIWVEAGPNHAGEIARLFRDPGTPQSPHGAGGQIDLSVGSYPDLHSFKFNDVISAIQITLPVPD